MRSLSPGCRTTATLLLGPIAMAALCVLGVFVLTVTMIPEGFTIRGPGHRLYPTAPEEGPTLDSAELPAVLTWHNHWLHIAARGADDICVFDPIGDGVGTPKWPDTCLAITVEHPSHISRSLLYESDTTWMSGDVVEVHLLRNEEDVWRQFILLPDGTSHECEARCEDESAPPVTLEREFIQMTY